jgi:hypothetical protein
VGANHTGMGVIFAQVTPVGLVLTDATVCPVAFLAAREVCWLFCAHLVRAAITQACQAPGLLEGRLDPFHRCDGRGGAVQEFVLNLDWWSVADLAVEPAVVEPVDVLSRRDFEVVDAPPGSLVADQFGFEEGVERLGEGVDAPIVVNSFSGARFRLG